jgi:hypothetical protein
MASAQSTNTERTVGQQARSTESSRLPTSVNKDVHALRVKQRVATDIVPFIGDMDTKNLDTDTLLAQPYATYSPETSYPGFGTSSFFHRQ